MRFELTQHYTSEPTEVDLAYADPGLYPTLVGLPKLGGIELLAHQGEPASRMKVRFRFTGHLPAAVTAVVHPARLTWIQETIHDHVARAARFRLVPDHYADRLECQGRFTIAASPTGSTRRVVGDLDVRAPLMASRVEQAIVSGLDEYLQAEAPVVDAWIAAAAGPDAGGPASG